jgi:hypothetical protein
LASVLLKRVEEEFDGLLAQADELAGGDAAAFLDQDTVEIDRELAADADIHPAPPLDAYPHYPILYAAEIQRPSGVFYLRGETTASGEYTLFVPRGGVLSRVLFFDPITKGVGLVSPDLRPEAALTLPSFSLGISLLNIASSLRN